MQWEKQYQCCCHEADALRTAPETRFCSEQTPPPDQQQDRPVELTRRSLLLSEPCTRPCRSTQGGVCRTTLTSRASCCCQLAM